MLVAFKAQIFQTDWPTNDKVTLIHTKTSLTGL